VSAVIPISANAVPAVGFEEFNKSVVAMAGKLPSPYMKTTWEGFRMNYKEYMNGQACNETTVFHLGAIGQNAVYIKAGNDIGGQAVLKVLDATTDTLELKGLYLWSVLVSITGVLHNCLACCCIVHKPTIVQAFESLSQCLSSHKHTTDIVHAAWVTDCYLYILPCRMPRKSKFQPSMTSKC
jgi:hypothetical protein